VDIGTTEACDPGDPETGVAGVCCPACKCVVDEVGGCAPSSVSRIYHRDCFVSYCKLPTGRCAYDFADEGSSCTPADLAQTLLADLHDLLLQVAVVKESVMVREIVNK